MTYCEYCGQNNTDDMHRPEPEGLPHHLECCSNFDNCAQWIDENQEKPTRSGKPSEHTWIEGTCPDNCSIGKDRGELRTKIRSEGHECVKNINIEYQFSTENGWVLLISSRQRLNGKYTNIWVDREIMGVKYCLFCGTEML